MSVLPLLSRLRELEINIKLVDDQLKINAPKGKLTSTLISELKEKKEEIIAFLQKNVQKQVKYAAIESVEEREYYDLFSAQRRMYILWQMEPDSIGYNMSYSVSLPVDTDRERLGVIFKRLIARHESLRTSFEMVDNEPVQKVHKEVDFSVEYCETVESEVEKIREGFIRPFDLSRVPLLRAMSVNIESSSQLLLIDMHHIITDGVSQKILEKEFAVLYAGHELPALRLRYRDFSRWQNNNKRKGLIREQELYWLRELSYSRELPVLSLPADYPRPSIQSFEGATVEFLLNPEESRCLKELAKEADATFYMSILAVFNILLARLSGQEDIVIGTPIAGRRHVDIEGLLGLFLNTLVLRNYPIGEKGVDEFLREVKERAVDAFENQDYQFEDLVEKVPVRRDTGRNPIFDVMFSMMTWEDFSGRIPEVAEDAPFVHKKSGSKFDLALTAADLGERFFFSIDYCTRLFKTATIERMIAYLKNILVSISKKPGQTLSELELMSTVEKQQLLFDFNGTRVNYPEHKTIHGLFEEQVERTPDSVVLIGRVESPLPVPRVNMQLTYRELNSRSNGAAAVLKEKGVVPDSIVAIMTERSVEMIIGILGILKAGGAYLPLDPDYPEDRIRFMLADSGVGILVTNRELSIDGQLSIVGCQLLMRSPNAPFHHSIIIDRHSGNLAYIIYTSGTTGRPKGVVVEHRNAVNTLLYRRGEYRLNADDAVLQLFSYAFDGFVTSFFTPIISGALVVLLSREEIREITGIGAAVVMHRVTHFISVPALFLAILKELSPEELRFLKVVTLAGDTLMPELVEITKEKNENLELAHEYGVTEAAVMSTIFRHQEKSGRVVIGKPIANTGVYILDRCGGLQVAGVPGELFISGAGVARGYLNNPELTAEKFDHDEKRTKKGTGKEKVLHSTRLYRTGDLARWLPDGNIEFLGRIDHQVKLRGFRIELGEIENQLLKHTQIKEVVVLAKGDGEVSEMGEGSGRHLCAYIVPYSGGSPGAADPSASGSLTISQLREYLSQKLPDYMIPSQYVLLEEIPLTSNGKIDRKSLDSAGTKVGIGGEYVAPASDIEKQVADIWMEVLEVDKVGIHDNFFDLGGNSLKVVRLNSKINRALGKNISVVVMFEYRTIHSFVEYLTREESGEQERGDRPEGKGEDRTEVIDRVKRRRAERKSRRRGE